MCEAGLWGITCTQQGTQPGGKPDRVVSPDSLSGTKLAVILECLRKETPAVSLHNLTAPLAVSHPPPEPTAL